MVGVPAVGKVPVPFNCALGRDADRVVAGDVETTVGHAVILVPALPLPVGEAHPFDPETVGLGTVPPGAEARIGRPAAQLAPRGRGCQEHQKRPRNRLGGGHFGKLQ